MDFGALCHPLVGFRRFYISQESCPKIQLIFCFFFGKICSNVKTQGNTYKLPSTNLMTEFYFYEKQPVVQSTKFIHAWYFVNVLFSPFLILQSCLSERRCKLQQFYYWLDSWHKLYVKINNIISVCQILLSKKNWNFAN